jgi:GNAT superfamily N-acetyltransferase
MAPVIELRPVRTAVDRETYVAVRNAIHPETPITIEAHFAETRQDDRADLLAYLAEVPVGTATGRRHFSDRESPLALVSVRVLREARRRGVGSALFCAISEHARSIGRTGLYTIVRLDDVDSNAYLGKRGFEEVLRLEEVSLPLAVAQPDTTPPDGVQIVPFGTEFDERVHPIAIEIDRDIPTAHPIAPLALDDWRRRMLGPGVLRELSFVAVAEDDVVGYAIVGEAEPGVADHWITGVVRDWRGRGLARALKAVQIDAARRAGLQELRSEYESENAPMRRINQRLGYRPRLTWLHLSGPLLCQ